MDTAQFRTTSRLAAWVAALANPATALSVLFPPDQTAAAEAYVEGIVQYPDFYTAGAAIETQQATVRSGGRLVPALTVRRGKPLPPR